MEEAITGDFSIVKAWKADTKGNVVFRKTARNFNPNRATAGRTCIVEVEEIVPAGSLDPDHIHLPSCYVDRIIRCEHYVKQIEFRTVSNEDGSSVGNKDSHPGRNRIVNRAAKEIKHGMNVNLGIGLPSLCANVLPKDLDVLF